MIAIKEYCGTILTFAAVVGLVVGSLAYFATASEVELLKQRLDQKIVSDQYYDTQRQIWMLEDRNVQYGPDCTQWPDERDRERYRELKLQLFELEQKREYLLRGK